MPWNMPGPWKHPTGIYYLRERIPADVRMRARGRKIAFEIDGTLVHVKVGLEHVKVSLRTKDRPKARERYKHASATFAAFCEAVRQGPRKLSPKEAVALSRDYYQSLSLVHATFGEATISKSEAQAAIRAFKEAGR
jgi:hypothetical protein